VNTFRGTSIPTSFDLVERVFIVMTAMSRSETRRGEDNLGQNATKMCLGQICKYGDHRQLVQHFSL
jgi:hypothetical protein